MHSDIRVCADWRARHDRYQCANRDTRFLLAQASQHGPAVGRFANSLLEGRQPWTRMRRVYALLGLCKRYGSERVNAVCVTALEADMLDVKRLSRMLEHAATPPDPEVAPAPSSKVIPIARYLRPKELYELSPANTRRDDKESHD